jgi:hypothetical protein
MAITHGAEQSQDGTQGNTSDSSRWLVAQQRLRESGIPPVHERLWASPTLAARADQHMEAALAECTRAEANLGSLLRGLSHLTAGATAAREANVTLLTELDTMRELLGRSNEDELRLRHRVQMLEQALETAEREAHLARALLIEQEDLFLVELLTDHERQIAALERRLAEAHVASERALTAPLLPSDVTPAPRRSDTLPQLGTLDELALDGSDFERHVHVPDDHRDSRIVPISTMPPPPDFEGDPGRAAGPISTMPPPPSFSPEESVPSVRPETLPPAPRAPESRPIATLMLRTISIGPGPLMPKPASSAELPEDPKALPVETAASSADAPPRHDSKPNLRQKPDPSTRPLVGYSLGSDDVAEERIDTSRISPRPKD